MRRRLRAAFSLAISLGMVLPPPTLVAPGIFLDLFGFNTRAMSRTVAAAMQSGAPSRIYLRPIGERWNFTGFTGFYKIDRITLG